MEEAHVVVVGAYLLGSVPSALIVGRLLARGDIRDQGDGNMGARNTAGVIGWGAGAAVAILDFGKGALAMWTAQQAALPGYWQLAAGGAAVAGHDFPLWAGFRGGQGMATSLGVLSLLVPVPTLLGLAVFGSAYLVLRSFDLSAAVGLGSIVVSAWRLAAPLEWVVFAAILFLSIGLKKAIDRPRREAITLDTGKPA